MFVVKQIKIYQNMTLTVETHTFYILSFYMYYFLSKINTQINNSYCLYKNLRPEKKQTNKQTKTRTHKKLPNIYMRIQQQHSSFFPSFSLTSMHFGPNPAVRQPGRFRALAEERTGTCTRQVKLQTEPYQQRITERMKKYSPTLQILSA